MKRVLYIIFLFLCLWIGYFIGRKNNNPTEIKERITEVRDTTIIRDTIIKEIIKPHYLTETIIRTDTIKADTAINLVKREYLTEIAEDSIRGQIKAIVSGYNPVLDTLQYNFIIPTKEITIEKEIITERIKKQRCNFGIFVGPSYNIVNRGFDISVGVGFTFNPF